MSDRSTVLLEHHLKELKQVAASIIRAMDDVAKL